MYCQMRGCVTHLRHQRLRNPNGQSFVLHVMTLTKILMLKIDMFYFSPTNFPLPRVWAGVRIFVINDSFRISSHRCGHGMSLESTGNQKNLLWNCQAHCVTQHLRAVCMNMTCLPVSQRFSPGLPIAGPRVIDSNCCKKQSSWRKTSGVLDIVIQSLSLDESSPRHFLLSLGVPPPSCQVISVWSPWLL